MELKPKGYEKIIQLINKGVDIPNPLTLDVGEEIKADRISGKGVRIYPGCRIYGDKTVISEGAQIGYEAPVTIENCQIGSSVELRGAFSKSPCSWKRRAWARVPMSARDACWRKKRAALIASG